MFTCVYILHRLDPLLGTKPDFFPGPFHISTSWFLILAEEFPNDYEAGCSTALRIAIEKNQMGG